MTMKAVAEPVILENEPCVHGMSNKNWCALCKEMNGDKHSTKMIKAFTPKRPKRKINVKAQQQIKAQKKKSKS